jgi:hypothetical protein
MPGKPGILDGRDEPRGRQRRTNRLEQLSQKVGMGAPEKSQGFRIKIL